MALGRSGLRAARGAAEEEEEQEAVEEHEPGAADGGFLSTVAERFAGLWPGLGAQFEGRRIWRVSTGFGARRSGTADDSAGALALPWLCGLHERLRARARRSWRPSVWPGPFCVGLAGEADDGGELGPWRFEPNSSWSPSSRDQRKLLAQRTERVGVGANPVRDLAGSGPAWAIRAPSPAVREPAGGPTGGDVNQMVLLMVLDVLDA